MVGQKVKDGDYVILSLSPQKTYLVKVEKGRTFHTHKGFVNFDDLIGRKYGLVVLSSLMSEFVVLKPFLKDYIVKSMRQTQIMYPKDIAMVVMFSGIGPGSRVVEAGTGAGALTTALAHYVRPRGRVYSYEVRERFQRIAEKNLTRAGVIDFVELKNKDITVGIDERRVDAVVLDLAVPWLVVPHAYSSLKSSGTLVSFSPTIDQVVKTVETLKDHNFKRVETVECLLRRMQVARGKTRPQTLMTGHSGYMTHAYKASKSKG